MPFSMQRLRHFTTRFSSFIVQIYEIVCIFVNMKTEHILSKSRLDLINKAPSLYKRKYIDGVNEQLETPALVLGKALHCRVFEPAEWGRRYTIAPDIDRRTKEGKERWAEFQQKSEGLTVVTREQDDAIERMNSAVYKHPAAAYLLGLKGTSEIMVNWVDEVSGIPCRGIFDRLTTSAIIMDLKTTDDASPKGFARSCHKYRYYVQAAFYMDGFERAYNQLCEGFFFIAVEKSEPHLVAVYYLTAEDIQRGRQQYREDIEKFSTCLKFDEWQGYGDGVQELTLFNHGK
jgi:hypothetical protein